MNMARLLLSLLSWEPFIKEFAKILGFCTQKAQDVIKNGVDHHWSNFLLSSCLKALSKQIIFPYVKYCRQVNISPKNDGFSSF